MSHLPDTRRKVQRWQGACKALENTLYICIVKGNAVEIRTRTHDRPQHDRYAACVITQQYSSATLISLHFHSRKENYWRTFEKKLLFQYSLDLKRNCLGSESESEWCEVAEVSAISFTHFKTHNINMPRTYRHTSKNVASLSKILWRNHKKISSPNSQLDSSETPLSMHCLFVCFRTQHLMLDIAIPPPSRSEMRSYVSLHSL
jgi:hypothetical protein